MQPSLYYRGLASATESLHVLELERYYRRCTSEVSCALRGPCAEFAGSTVASTGTTGPTATCLSPNKHVTWPSGTDDFRSVQRFRRLPQSNGHHHLPHILTNSHCHQNTYTPQTLITVGITPTREAAATIPSKPSTNQRSTLNVSTAEVPVAYARGGGEIKHKEACTPDPATT